MTVALGMKREIIEVNSTVRRNVESWMTRPLWSRVVAMMDVLGATVMAVVIALGGATSRRLQRVNIAIRRPPVVVAACPYSGMNGGLSCVKAMIVSKQTTTASAAPWKTPKRF